MKYFSTFFTSRAIIAYLAVLMISAWLFIPRFLPFIWIFFGFISVFTFFYFSTILSLRWAEINSKIFKKKVFINALIIRLIYVILIYFFYKAQTGVPFEFNAGDAIGYHNTANWLVDLFFQGWLHWYFTDYLKGVSDAGWELTMAFVYLISFRSILIIRLFNALFSAITVILIYKICKNNFGEKAARISAIMAMLLPSFIFYSGLHLKETFMVFLLIYFIERADFLLHSKNFSISIILQVILLGVSLFFFRTVLAVAAWFALGSAFIFTSEKLMSQYKRIVILCWFIIAVTFTFSGKISNEVTQYAGMSGDNQKGRLEVIATRKGANQLAKYGSAFIFIPIIIPAPFPTLVNIPEQQNQMMTNGDLFTRNIYVFFVFVAFYVLISQKMIRKYLLLLVFLITYLLILANSGFALSPRFHVPALPFLLMFAGFGITQTNRNISSYYILYIIAISLFIIAWNWFKLAGRGMV